MEISLLFDLDLQQFDLLCNIVLVVMERFQNLLRFRIFTTIDQVSR